MASSLSRKVISGVTWVALGRIGQRIFAFIFSIILARLLFPDDFGTIGIVMVFVGYANLFAEVGITSSLVQMGDMKEEHAQSAFWVTFFLSLMLTCIMFLGAPLIAEIYHIPLLIPLARALSFIFIISAFQKIPYSLLQRRMEFRKYSYVNFLGTIFSGTIGVALAFSGAGIWSLVAQVFIGTIVTSLLMMYLARWLPKPIFSVQAIKDMWGFSLSIFGAKSLEYWSRQVDNLIIGFVFSAFALGLYTRAYALLLLPLAQIVGITYIVMFPALSSIQDDKARVKAIYLRTISVIAVVVCPMMFGLAVVAEPFVLVVYGDRWAGMVSLVKILALVSILQTFMNPTEWIFSSQGRANLMLRWRIVSVSIQVVGFIVGALLGSVEALALCYLIVTIFLFYPENVIAGRLIGLRFSELFKVVSTPILGGVAMVAGVMIVQNFMIGSGLSKNIELIISVAVGVIIYLAFLLIVKPSGWQELITIVRQRLVKQQPAPSS